MTTNNFIFDLIGKISEPFLDIYAEAYKQLGELIHTSDYGLLIVLTTFILTYVYFYLIQKITVIFSTVKTAFSVTGTVFIFSQFFYKPKGIDFSIFMSSIVWFVLIALLTIAMVMERPYYEGLFGRFKDSFEN